MNQCFSLLLQHILINKIKNIQKKCELTERFIKDKKITFYKHIFKRVRFIHRSKGV